MHQLLISLVALLLFSACAPIPAATNWFADAVWYQIFPERFRNGDTNNDPVPGNSIVAVFNAGEQDASVSLEKLGLNGADGWPPGSSPIRGETKVETRWFSVLERNPTK